MFQLFSKTVISAMKIYKQTDVELQTCDSTVNVLTKINDLITAMTSRSSENALTPDSSNLKVHIF